MSLCDSYRELELYLEQAENEITQVFENGNATHEDISKAPDSELDPFLLHFNATIRSDLTEIFTRHIAKEIQDEPHINGHQHANDDVFSQKRQDDNISSAPSLESLLNSLSIYENNSINATTQTCSLSPCSTNLTWASECSSSPCLSSTSNTDEDSHLSSSSSTDGKEEVLLTAWGGKTQWTQALSAKSSSAPVLKKVPIKVSKQARSQSDRHLAEIEAAEACKWLRATGFPQYAQMYEDMQFPIDVSTVAQDHPLLESDVLHSLFRRLQILNKCAHLHQQRITHANTDDSEDEEHCALSDNWTYQKDIRRWSRTCKNYQLSNLEDNKSLNYSQEDVFEKSTENTKEKFRRVGSTKFNRFRDGVIISDSGPELLDSLTQQFSYLKNCEVNHVSDSECTPKFNRRARAKSFYTGGSWMHSQPSEEGISFYNLPQEKIPLVEKSVNNENNNGPIISSLSCTQLQVLRKLALLKLTAHMEKYCLSHRTGWNWDLPKFIRKIKAPVYKDKSVFGVPLTITLQRTGQALPRNIEEALLWLQQNASDQVGLFRKSGVKSRIQALRNLVDTTAEILNYNDYQSYDVADMVKQYFRELPETLLTNKLSETFILIFQYVPPFLRPESVLCAILLMPNEHVEVLQSLLYFLLKISQHAATNQMNESNLALCFAPSLFYYPQMSFKQSLGMPHPKELAETRAAHDCLLYLLKNIDRIFKVPKEFITQCKMSEFKETKAVTLVELGRSMGGWREYLGECQAALLKERGRGWMLVSCHSSKVEISYKKVADGHPLRLWKVTADVEAPPAEVLHRIIRERHIWDPELHSAKIVSQIEHNCEVFQFVRRNVMPLPNEEYCVVRSWRTDLPKDACLIVETSIEHQDAVSVPHTVRGIVLASRYLIEPCGSGKSRLLHLSRIDTMGRAPEWYQKNYGHIAAVFIANIVNSFYQNAAGPESKV